MFKLLSNNFHFYLFLYYLSKKNSIIILPPFLTFDEHSGYVCNCLMEAAPMHLRVTSILLT